MQSLEPTMLALATHHPRSQAPAAPKAAAPAAPSAPKDSLALTTVGRKVPKATSGNLVVPAFGGDKATDQVIGALKSAKSSIQCELYRLGYDKIVDVLMSQAKAGVKVQVLLDPTPGYDPKDAEAQAAMVKQLKASGVEVLRYPIDKKDKIDHVKLLIVDGKKAVIGGLNWDRHSHENLDMNVQIEGPAVGDLSNVFANDWKISGGKSTPAAKPTTPTLPDGDDGAKVRVATTEVDNEGIRKLMLDNINGAKKSIRMLAFALADKEVLAALIAAKKERGVDIKIMLDPNKPVSYVNEKSKKLLEEAGIEVRYLKVDVANEEKLHAKMMQVDDDRTIVGSANFTYKGLTVNHESEVEVVSKAMGPAVQNFFDDLWENRSLAKLPPLPDLEETASEEPYGHQACHNLFTWYQDTYHPNEKHNWTGKRKDAILGAYDKYYKKYSNLVIKAPAGAPEEEQIGSLAAFLAKRQVYDIIPAPGSYEKVWQKRIEIAKEGEKTVPGQVERYKKEMVDGVNDPELKALLKNILDQAPHEFYMSPSSSTGKYHPADEVRVVNVEPRLEPPTPEEEAKYPGGGLVLHSRRNMELARNLCDYYEIQGKQRDEVLMALALHDIMKFVSMKDFEAWKPGQPFPWGRYTTPEHAHVGAEFVKRLDPTGGKLTENVRRYIDMHMGAWNAPTPTPPKDDAEKVISMADYLGSEANNYVKV
jgi:cardiolipin synthase